MAALVLGQIQFQTPQYLHPNRASVNSDHFETRIRIGSLNECYVSFELIHSTFKLHCYETFEFIR